MSLPDLAQETRSVLQRLGVPEPLITGHPLTVTSPISGEEIGSVAVTSDTEIDTCLSQASQAFLAWRMVPAPRRGELIRLFAEELRAHKEDLGKLVTLEAGKILSEGLGEVQEMIDICDFAVGQSRMLYGKTIASERPGHRMQEAWHPAGPVGVISAFNFPVAVWSWNTALAIVCGDPVVWKPSEKTPLTALACQALFEKAVARFEDAPDHLLQVVNGGQAVGNQLVTDKRLPIISATGSTAMGRIVAPKVAARFGKAILELGGNNAMIVCPSADLDLAVRAITFSAVGTAGQRCTSLRRVFVHQSIADTLVRQLRGAYESLPIGNPLDAETLVGPLIDQEALAQMQSAIAAAEASGGQVYGGEPISTPDHPNAAYVKPALVVLRDQTDDMREETFAPLLYVVTYRNLEQAIHLQNDVPQGLSSCIFTNDLREAEVFLSAAGSDCGIANVNIGPSGAEIGGAFGGEKETGGGREAGSDSWQAYMRRATNTVNYSNDLPLAQGVKFEIGGDDE